jgi:hypothetical protein
MKENEMGQACSLCGKRKEMHTGFWSKNTLKKKDHMENSGTGGRITLTLCCQAMYKDVTAI